MPPQKDIKEKWELWVGGKNIPAKNGKVTHVTNPYTGEVIAEVSIASKEDVEAAIESALTTFKSTTKHMPSHKVSEILYKTSGLIAELSEDFARTISLEAGKPIRESRGEVSRAVQVFRLAAEEANRISGEVVPTDAVAGAESRFGLVVREPLGVIGAIAPFNFPLNLVVHKVAPAIAAKNTIVLKPAEKTPLSSLKLARVLHEAGLPPGALNVVMGSGPEVGSVLVQDERVRMITFTGSVPVGKEIKEKSGLKKVTLELGANSPNIVCADADIDSAARALVPASFAYAGQVCISAQRILVHKDVEELFRRTFINLVKSLKIGDPLEETTDMGPMISESEVRRTKEWVDEAKRQGAKVLIGGTGEGNVFYPTVLSDVKPSMRVVCQEVFAPVVSIIPFRTNEEAVELANDSTYGLQAGVFTQNLNTALYFAQALEVGGVWINESTIYRQQNAPYGGVKMSGLGREGVKYTIEEMTELKFIGIKGPFS
ncbi:MAG TPA: aldehyde dehydrogenase family protein [Thermodesulfobacteriota bacterium]|nr:aldehyde dehydrogenase family protein [Thermodesulfobacteriota bacterium]